ncbi:glycosyltransferase [Candidatus Sumerlaeota bacterium]|nr:glycosyltransferase [Candidatus Sumerlaeota bacterium]
MTKNFPTITIVICARNAAQQLHASIPAALAQDYPRNRFRLLVVDNGSSDGTASTARELGANAVRRHPKPGIAGARRFALGVARSELIAFLDADCEPPTNWLSSLVAEFEAAPKVAAVGVRLVGDSPRTLAEQHIEAEGIMDTDRMFTRNALQFPFVPCAGMMARCEALLSVGAFDSSFLRAAGEDADACWRLQRHGWEVRYQRDTNILHHHRATLSGMLRQAHWYGAGSAALFARWRKELGYPRYTDWRVYRRIATSALAAPFALVLRSGYARFAPGLRALDALAFLTGKLRQSLKERVLFL